MINQRYIIVIFTGKQVYN